MRRIIRALIVCVGILGAVMPAAAEADTSAPVWTCRSSPARADVAATVARAEPIVANGRPGVEIPVDANRVADRPQCVDDEGFLPQVRVPSSGTAALTADAARAFTEVEPDLEDARLQRVSATTVIEDVAIPMGAGSVIRVQGVFAQASGACVAGTPTFSSTSRVLGLTINGATPQLNLSQENARLEIPGVLRITANETETVTASGSQRALIRRALHVEVLSAAPNTVADVVLGEAVVGRAGDVCAPPPTTTCPVDSVAQQQPDGTTICIKTVTAPCPAGTETRPDGACVQVIREDGPCPAGFTRDGPGRCTRVVRQAAPCPSGTTRDANGACIRTVTVRIQDVPCRGCEVRPTPPDFEPCKNRRRWGGFAIFGTRRSDRITGTNGKDVILGLAGGDSISGGRGPDCLEGGNGKDRLDGSNANDVLRGGAGPDSLNGGNNRDRLDGGSGNDRANGGSHQDTLDGGAGRDRLSGGGGNDVARGGSGNDIIEMGAGYDRVFAGSGNDIVNVATNGKPDLVNCGAGRDVVRVNVNDRHRNCERVLVATNQDRNRR